MIDENSVKLYTITSIPVCLYYERYCHRNCRFIGFYAMLPYFNFRTKMNLRRLPGKVYFLIINEFCERFCYYGLRTILILYLNEFLGIPYNSATAAFHTFVCLCYASPIIGAVLADGYIGRMYTILILSSIYALGCVLLSLTAIPLFGAPTL
ncbi:hypothetical protein GJ496_011904 [Pomphorhynchus laevis]|nr:hypothetical protein GJ496_011904 [Pomphorhynchus laevis]